MKALFQLSFVCLTFCKFAQGQCVNSGVGTAIIQPKQVNTVSSTCSTLAVKWQGSPNQTYCVSATYFNTITNKKDTAFGSNTVCDSNQNCTDTIPVIAGAQVTWSVTAIENGNASYPVINVLEYPIPACGGSGVSFCGKMMLQGAYDAVAKQMRTTLNDSGILNSFARQQPYNTAAFNYSGSDSVSAGFFAAHPDIVDWVLVEIRDANAPSQILAQRAAFVKKDGTLVDTSGANTHINFAGITPAKYHAAIRHRNHLAVRTAFPVDFTCNLVCYDFTTASSRAFRKEIYPSTVQLGNIWAMRGGDANINNNVSYNGSSNDKAVILNQVGAASPNNRLRGYYLEDVNMDGYVKYNGAANDKNAILIFIEGLSFPGKIIFGQFPD